MFFRIISAVMFTVMGGTAGIYFSERLKSDLSFCRNIHEMFMNTAVIIRCSAVDVYSISTELRKNKKFQRFDFLQAIPEKYNPEEDFREIWINAVKSQKNLPEDVKNILCDFGQILGQSDIEGQLASIETLTEKAGILEKNYSDIYSQKGKLYRSIGMLFGIITGILII